MDFSLLNLSLTILLLPIVSFLILIFVGKRLPRQGDWLGTAILFVNLALSVVVFIQFFTHGKFSVSFDWINLGKFSFMGKDIPEIKFSAGIIIDEISSIMLIVVNLISAVVHLFSIKYMEGDTKYSIYFAYLGLFTFSMLGIVLTNNLIIMYVFWELVGISSYLLIGFWYEKKAPQEASKKAFIVNRVGDVGFFLGIMILFYYLGNLNFADIFTAIKGGAIPPGILTAAGILLFCGAVGKSAQFPLHVWLPDAMEGPTPVSALIHAATMVAAGVYMVARIFVILSPDALTVITYTGAITAFISATIALTQNDIKKVLAYSTISQLGYMIMALGVGAFSFGMFHLVTHAFFKACLFLGSGSVIYGMHHEQDINQMGGLKKKMPLTYWTFLISTLAISGVPLTSGFLSKDSILAATLAFAHNNGGINVLIPLIAFSVAGMTAFYMFRLVIKTFYGEPKNKEKFEHCKESPLQMTLPLIILSVLSIFIFYTPNPIDVNSGWIFNFLKNPESMLVGAQGSIYKILDVSELQESIHHAHYTAMALSILISGFGILMAYVFFYWRKVDVAKLKVTFKPLYDFSLNKWYFDELYDKTAVAFTMLLSKASSWFDRNIIDGAVNGSALVTRKVSDASGKIDNFFVDGIVNLAGAIVGVFGYGFKKLITGTVQTYVTFLLFGLILLYFIFRFI